MKRSLAEKLDRLFKVVRPAGGGEYTYDQVAEGVRQRGVSTVSAAYVWQLRHGARDNPSLRLLEGLADFFGVPVGYFSDEEVAARVDGQLELLASLRDADIRHIAMRLLDVSPESRAVVAEAVAWVRRREGLDPSLIQPKEEPDPG